MTRNRRNFMLATIVSLLGATAAIPMIVSGTASAQENSRICGREWTTDANSKFKERIFRIYEVPKEGSAECDWAKSSSNDSKNPLNSPFKLGEQTGTFWNTSAVRVMTCEDFTKKLREDPTSTTVGSRGPGVRRIENYSDNKPIMDETDICNNMDRSDNRFEMERYWLYQPNYESNFAEGPWKFQG